MNEITFDEFKPAYSEFDPRVIYPYPYDIYDNQGPKDFNLATEIDRAYYAYVFVKKVAERGGTYNEILNALKWFKVTLCYLIDGGYIDRVRAYSELDIANLKKKYYTDISESSEIAD